MFSHYLLSRFKAEMWDKLKKKIKNLIIGCEKSISNFHNLNFQTFLWFLCGHVFFVFKLNPDIVEEEKRIRDDKLLPVNMCASRNRLIYRYITVLYIQGIKCCSAKMHKCILWQLLKLQLCSKRRLLSFIRMKKLTQKALKLLKLQNICPHHIVSFMF